MITGCCRYQIAPLSSITQPEKSIIPLTENFVDKSGQLTEDGFIQMYSHVLEALEGGEEEFYENSLESLGFNRLLEPDEIIAFKVGPSPDTASVGSGCCLGPSHVVWTCEPIPY